jgi:GNAT superfamily N-acetyltransferase
METARRAIPADLADLAALLEAASTELADLRGGPLLNASLARQIPAAAALALDLEDPSRLVVVGELEGVALGLALARQAVFDAELIGVVDTIYVAPDAREVGLGEAMVELVMAWCQEQGCRGVDAPALPGHRKAKAFFEDNGFVARLLIMHRSWPERPESQPDEPESPAP